VLHIGLLIRRENMDARQHKDRAPRRAA
jgi:hypothetical protein